ncbi:hypothetical protein VPH35_105622 [Triticum aestivum]
MPLTTRSIHAKASLAHVPPPTVRPQPYCTCMRLHRSILWSFDTSPRCKAADALADLLSRYRFTCLGSSYVRAHHGHTPHQLTKLRSAQLRSPLLYRALDSPGCDRDGGHQHLRGAPAPVDAIPCDVLHAARAAGLLPGLRGGHRAGGASGGRGLHRHVLWRARGRPGAHRGVLRLWPRVPGAGRGTRRGVRLREAVAAMALVERVSPDRQARGQAAARGGGACRAAAAGAMKCSLSCRSSGSCWRVLVQCRLRLAQ